MSGAILLFHQATHRPHRDQRLKERDLPSDALHAGFPESISAWPR